MTQIKFKNGVVSLDTVKETEKNTAVFLAFNPANLDRYKFEAIESAMPRIHGLRRKSHRQSYAFDIIQNLEQQGYEIRRKQFEIITTTDATT